jgi:hypothetical protein
MELPSNACIRTDPRWDKAVRHLGYEPVTLSTEENTGNLRKDTDLIAESQENLSHVVITPDDQLTPGQLAALSLIREINNRNARATEIHAAVIPPASDRVRTAGMYGRHDQRIYVSLDQLGSGRMAVGTAIHEMSHHTSGEEDGVETHENEIKKLASSVIDQVSRGDYDAYLKNPALVW